MTVLPNAYLEIDNVEYFDYTIYTRNRVYFHIPHPGKSQIINKTVAARLNTLDGLVDSLAFPKKGSSIFVAPGCPYNLQNIRKNYTIKRNKDTADYIVLSPFDKTQSGESWSEVVIVPSQKAICLFDGDHSIPHIVDPAGFARQFVNNFSDDEVIHIIPERRIFLYGIDLPDVYLDALQGKCTKPCVHINNLDLSNGLDVTPDLLTLIYKAGSVFFNEKDAEKNLLVQLNVLNTHNWREYTGTISILFNSILGKNRACILQEMRSHKTQYSKDICQILKLNDNTFCGEKDFYLAQEFMNSILHIDDCKFATLEDVNTKLIVAGINESDFSAVFSPVVRITPRKFADGKS